MERLKYSIELADNGMIVSIANGGASVFQKRDETCRDCYKRGFSDTIASYIADIMTLGTETTPVKEKYNIKIEIR